MDQPDITLEYVKEPISRYVSIYNKNPNFSYRPHVQTGHSQTGFVNLTDRKRRSRVIFIKRYFTKGEHGDSSPLYAAIRDPHALYTCEKNAVHKIKNNVGPDLVPQLFGHDDAHLTLFFDYAGSTSDRDRFLKAKKDEDDKEKLGLVYKGAQKIAHFDGRLEGRKDIFTALDRNESRMSASLKAAKIVDYLLTIFTYHRRQFGEEVPDNPDMVKEMIRAKYDGLVLSKSVEEIVRMQESFDGGNGHVLQHGDCRVHHSIGDYFVDLELFGSHPHGYDLVTYLNAEGGIAMPPTGELPMLLAWFLAFESANRKNDYKERAAVIRTLEDRGRENILDQMVMADYQRFMSRFLMLDIIENLHLDSSNKRYNDQQRADIVRGIPNYTTADMMQLRLDHIGEVFKLVGENSLLFGVGESGKIVRHSTGKMAELLKRLELVDTPAGVLEKLLR